MEVLILITPNWEKEFHVHTNASNSVVGVMLAQNMDGKCDQLIAYALRLLSTMERSYIMLEREMLAMVTPFINSTTTFLTKEMFFMLTTWP